MDGSHLGRAQNRRDLTDRSYWLIAEVGGTLTGKNIWPSVKWDRKIVMYWVCKERSWPILAHCTNICLERPSKAGKTSVGIPGHPTEIRYGHLPNSSLIHYNLISLSGVRSCKTVKCNGKDWTTVHCSCSRLVGKNTTNFDENTQRLGRNSNDTYMCCDQEEPARSNPSPSRLQQPRSNSSAIAAGKCTDVEDLHSILYFTMPSYVWPHIRHTPLRVLSYEQQFFVLMLFQTHFYPSLHAVFHLVQILGLATRKPILPQILIPQ